MGDFKFLAIKFKIALSSKIYMIGLKVNRKQVTGKDFIKTFNPFNLSPVQPE